MSNGYYMMQVNPVNKRSQSAVAMSAYRSDEKLYSLRDGEIKTYKKHIEIPESFILKPNHAPEWTKDRSELWNAVEEYESQDNARIARNVLLPLPNDMTNDQQTETAKEFIQENFVDHGMVADVSIHRDDKNNPHAHVLLTVRPFQKNGEWEPRKSKRVPTLDENGNQMYNEKGWKKTHSIKINNWDKKETLLLWRENWANKLNSKSKEFGSNKVYSHRSYADQEKTKKPQFHLTRSEYYFEMKNKEQCEKKGETYTPITYYAQKNEEIKRYNKDHQNIISLEEYKVNKDYRSYLNNIKKNHTSDPKYIEATKTLVKRAKGYVDYQIAKDMYNNFSSNTNKWKLNIERDFASLNAEKSYYKNIIDNYHKNPDTVKAFGYDTNNFKDQIKQDLNKLQHRFYQKEEEKNKFEELKNASELGYQYQKEMLNLEFTSMYNNHQSFNNDEKYFAMKLLKESSIYLPENQIKEEYRKNKDRYLNNNMSQVVPAWKQAKNLMKSIRIYNNALAKYDRQDLNKLSPDERKNEVVKARSFEELRKQYEQYINELDPIINHELSFYVKDNIAHLENEETETKVALLDEYNSLSSEETQNINTKEMLNYVYQKESMKASYNEQMSKESNNDKDREAYSMMADESQEISDGLLNAINTFEETQTNEMDQAKRKKHPLMRKSAGKQKG